MDSRIATGLAIAALVVIAPISARAGPCAGQIAEFEQLLRQQPEAVGAAPQSVGAQLEHQPTPASVESAKHGARAEILTVLSQAKALDAQGKQDECIDALAKAKLLLNP
jgi:hypothetical protein